MGRAHGACDGRPPGPRCSVPGGAQVTLDARASSDQDNDPLTYTCRRAVPPENVGDATFGTDDRAVLLRAQIRIRAYTAIYAVTYGSGNRTTASAIVQVRPNRGR